MGGGVVTNYEKYHDKIFNIGLKEFAITEDGEITSCKNMHCNQCLFLIDSDCKSNLKKWLQEEYVEPVDWTKVAVDTPILVRAEVNNSWEKRHFAKYEDGTVYAWIGGMTSFTVEDGYIHPWKYAKLAEGKE